MLRPLFHFPASVPLQHKLNVRIPRRGTVIYWATTYFAPSLFRTIPCEWLRLIGLVPERTTQPDGYNPTFGHISHLSRFLTIPGIQNTHGSRILSGVVCRTVESFSGIPGQSPYTGLESVSRKTKRKPWHFEGGQNTRKIPTVADRPYSTTSPTRPKVCAALDSTELWNTLQTLRHTKKQHRWLLLWKAETGMDDEQAMS